MADWTRAAEEMNKIGEQAQKAGIQVGFHNPTTANSKRSGAFSSTMNC